MKKILFESDYMEGAYPLVLERLIDTNLKQTSGYGSDEYCESARQKIRVACGVLEAEVKFLVGGTQTNATVINGLLRHYQGVIAADSGHISTHEAGAIEFGGNKILNLSGTMGKISAQQVENYLIDFYNDSANKHMVQPGMVYISHPSEYGTLYTLEELEKLSRVCKAYGLPLYLDGARLAYALASKENDVTLKDIARLCDVFYIGGTKCGTLFGEAVVIPNPKLIPSFTTIIKQHGALLAKGRLLGIQFDVLFENDLYLKIGKQAVENTMKMKECLKDNGYRLLFETYANQLFVIVKNKQLNYLQEKIGFSKWMNYDDEHSVIRLTTSWATTKEDVQRFVEIIQNDKKEYY